MRPRIAALFSLLGLAAAAQERFSGEADIRNRFVVRDEYPVYRSIVNLGRGPRLFGLQARYEGTDTVGISVTSLGDPNSDIRINARRAKVYEALFSYRTMAYFNNLPSFANPLLAQGVAASQRAIDLSRRQLDFDLRLRPDAHLIPFFSLLRTSGSGDGITVFTGGGDEFPVPVALRDALTTTRGGVELRWNRWSGTVEQGWTGYTDEQSLDSGRQPGNRPDNIVLNRLVERYWASGGGLFSRGAVQGQPLTNLSFTGHLIYSRPRLDADHSLQADGAFHDPATLRPYTNLFDQSFANASQPRTSGSWTTEYRPFAHWRFRHNWFSDAYRISASSTAAAALSEPADRSRGLVDLRYHQSEAEVSGEVGKYLTVRAGHRYIHSNAELPPPTLTFPTSTPEARIRRHAALAGATLNLWKGRVQTHGSYEWSPGGQTYFRTGLLDYRKIHVQGRVRLSDRIRVTASHRDLTNDNMGNKLTSRQTSVTAEWTPGAARRVTFAGGYTREIIRSMAMFANPGTLQPTVSRYDDLLHHANGYADFRLVRGAQLQAGGSFSHSEGSRPTRYYNPQSQLVLASNSRVSGVVEWRWYRYRAVEAFRAHVVSAGVRFRFGAGPH